MGIETRIIYRLFTNDIGGGKFQRRKDKKLFFIERIDQTCEPKIKIDGQEFFTISQGLKKFNLRKKKFISQMVKNHFGFLDSEKNPHKVDWMHETLLNLFQAKKIKRFNAELIKLEGKVKQSVVLRSFSFSFQI